MAQPFLERIAPTVGSIIGGIGGAALGGAVDVGTLGLAAPVINPFTMGVAGAGLGGAAGQAVKNYGAGQSPIQQNDVGAAESGAIGQAVGGAGGALLGKVGEAFGGLGSRMAEKAGVREAVGGLTTGEKEDLNVDNSVKLAKNMGISFKDPQVANQAMVDARDMGTGDNGLLNGTIDQIVHDTFQNEGKGIDFSDFDKTLTDKINGQSSLSAEPTTYGRGGQPRMTGQVSTIRSNVSNALQNFGYGGEGSLDANADPGNALDLQRQLYSMSKNETNPAASKVYKQMADYVKGKVYTPEVNAAVKNFTADPETTSRILSDSAKKFGSTQPGQFLLDTLNNATKASDVTDVERQLIDMGETGKAALSRNAANSLGAPTPAEEAVGHLTSGSQSRAAAALLKGSSVSGKTSEGIGNLLERMSPFTSKGKDANVINKLPGVLGSMAVTLPGAANGGSNGMENTAMGTPMNTQPGAAGAVGQSPYGNVINDALTQMILDPNQASNSGTILSQVMPALQKSAQSQALLGQGASQFGAAGGGAGYSGNGALDSILARIPGTPQYAARQQLLQALQAAGLNPNMVPSFMSNDATAGGQLGAIGAGAGALGGGGSLLSQVQ